MTLLLGIDLGTSYFKVGVFDEAGSLKGMSRIAVQPVATDRDRCELPVEQFWQRLRVGLIQALADAGAMASDIAGVSYSSQANSFVLLDTSDNPLTPLILWPDTRGEPLAEPYRKFAQSPQFGRKTGFTSMSGNWAVAKMISIRAKSPALWTRTKRIMTIADYFTFALTGEAVGDAGTAALLGLYDLGKGQWWPEAFGMFAMDSGKFSRPLFPGTRSGCTVDRATALLGLPAGIPFAVGGLDHQVAALGSGIGRLADVSISTGTVLAALALTDEVSPQDGCYHGPDFYGRRYFRMAFDPGGAGQLESYQREFASHLNLEEMIALAEAVPAGGTRLTQPAGNLTERGHGVVVRRILEQIGTTQSALIAKITRGRSFKKIVATGGGARSAVWLQIKADIIGVPIVTTASQERACLGAAMLAGVSTGVFADIGAASANMVHAAETFLPDPARHEQYRNLRSSVGG